MERNNITVFILIDAFRPDYIKKAPFIAKLSGTGLSGSLIPPFGFMSTSGAIFAGLDPEKSNLCHKFCLNRESSPFRFIPPLPAGKKAPDTAPLKPAGGIGKLLISLLVRLKERRSAVSYYGSPEMIPLALLPRFDFGQKKRPDEDGFVPQPSLFDILKREKKTYRYFGFARGKSFREYTRKFMRNVILKKRYDEDERLVKIFKEDVLKSNCDFLYLHLNLLDSSGHCFGPASYETQEAIAITDKRIEKLYNFFKDRFPSFNFVLCSDHGMTEVKETVDIREILLKSGLKIGTDLIPFLDATQARFWGGDKAIASIRDMLGTVKGGRFLTEDDFVKFGLRFKDNRYGDLFWVCEEGKIISPNFFDGSPPKGAHGYIPGSKDDFAFYLINGEGIKPGRNGAGDLKDIFPSLLKLMKLPVPSSSGGKVLF
jgi:hypothetical protein